MSKLEETTITLKKTLGALQDGTDALSRANELLKEQHALIKSMRENSKVTWDLVEHAIENKDWGILKKCLAIHKEHSID